MTDSDFMLMLSDLMEFVLGCARLRKHQYMRSTCGQQMTLFVEFIIETCLV